jgi:RNA polymerase sigma factor (sigma-70 family)
VAASSLYLDVWLLPCRIMTDYSDQTSAWSSRPRMTESKRVAAFTRIFEPHLDAAYGLARWLLGNDQDAEDSTQDAYLRALRHFDRFNGTNPRGWLLTIVRSCCYTMLAKTRPGTIGSFEEDEHSQAADVSIVHGQRLEGPEQAVLRAEDARLLNAAVGALPVEQREAFVLREIEGLSYKDIAEIAGIPIGTVMSRLARARTQLRNALRDVGEAP